MKDSEIITDMEVKEFALLHLLAAERGITHPEAVDFMDLHDEVDVWIKSHDEAREKATTEGLEPYSDEWRDLVLTLTHATHRSRMRHPSRSRHLRAYRAATA